MAATKRRSPTGSAYSADRPGRSSATARRPPSTEGSLISEIKDSPSTSSTYELLLNSEDIATFLHDFTAVLAERLSDKELPAWCAVSLLREKKAGTVASSSAQAEALDELQNGFPDGPCLTAVREHTVVRVGDVRDDPRWADFHAAAAKQGVRSVLGVPFELHGDANAGMNLYSATPHDFGPDLIESIRDEVLHASSALRLAVQLARHREAEQDLHAAMASRTVIDLAVGIVMGQSRCSRDEAITILKAASNHRNLKLRDLAADLVASVDSQSPGTHFEF